jgi:hypothetical protein
MAALIVSLSSGAALADRHHGGGGWGGGGRVTVHENRGGGWNGGGRAVVREHNSGWNRGGGWSGGVRVDSGPRYYHNYGRARANIYFPRPVIHERYYDYRFRPRVVVENYGPRYGYNWISGQWSWSGYEWVWTPGYYQPDSAYVEVY